MKDDPIRTAEYYDRAATAYDAQVDGRESNRSVRRALRERVAAVTSPGGTVLDFGCGTGIDAEWYAARGITVVAYDISSGMVDQLRIRCAHEIAVHRIIPVVGDLDALAQSLESVPRPETVAANFAVLNHFADLHAIITRLADFVVSDGSIVASLLSPFHGPDIRRRWWWTGAARAMGTGAITVHGDVSTHRFLPRTIRRAGRPRLELLELSGAPETDSGSVHARRLLGAQFWLAVWKRCR